MNFRKLLLTMLPGEEISAEKNGCYATNVAEEPQSETDDTEELEKRMSFVLELEKAEECFGRNSLME